MKIDVFIPSIQATQPMPAGFVDRSRLGITVGFADAQVVVTIVGELDLGTVSQLVEALNEVTDRGHGGVVLDLAGLDFMAVGGLGVIAARARKLRTLGDQLTIRSPSTMVSRMVMISELADVLRIEYSGD